MSEVEKLHKKLRKENAVFSTDPHTVPLVHDVLSVYCTCPALDY